MKIIKEVSLIFISLLFGGIWSVKSIRPEMGLFFIFLNAFIFSVGIFFSLILLILLGDKIFYSLKKEKSKKIKLDKKGE